MRALTALTLASLLAACGTQAAAPGSTLPPTTADSAFWDHWGDGRAEVATYALTTPRYGEARAGEAVWITVTEDFDGEAMVKSDRAGANRVPVLKWNEARDFHTGVYDYHVMTSAFVALDGRAPWGEALKVTSSSQEWCGHTWDQLVRRDDGYHHTVHSYFEGESFADRVEAVPADAVVEDALPLLVRGLLGDPLAEGPLTVRLLPKAMDARFEHRTATFETATIARGEAETVDVPAGAFEAAPVAVDAAGHDTTFWVQTAPPHRIVKFTRSNGEVGELVAVERMPYWQLNTRRDGPRRQRLGLPERRFAGEAP